MASMTTTSKAFVRACVDIFTPYELIDLFKNVAHECYEMGDSEGWRVWNDRAKEVDDLHTKLMKKSKVWNLDNTEDDCA